jgi:hypothetical protein
MDEKVKAVKKTADRALDSTEIIETRSQARSDTDDFRRFVVATVRDAVFFKADGFSRQGCPLDLKTDPAQLYIVWCSSK